MKKTNIFLLLFFLAAFLNASQLKAVKTNISATATIYTKSCNNPLDSVTVTLTAEFSPFNVYTEISDTNGVAMFDGLDEGLYTISGSKFRYNTTELNSISVGNGFSMDLQLSEKAYPVRNFKVDPLSSLATWDAPRITALSLEGFEDTAFPPQGWETMGNNSINWHRNDTLIGNIPEWDSHYAECNYYVSGKSSREHHYLITPPVDLRESNNYQMNFDRFISTEYEMGRLEYTLDNGATWVVLTVFPPSLEWKPDDCPLTPLSGEDGYSNIRFAFDYEGDYYSYGMAVDNVEIVGDTAAVVSYDLFLNDVLVATLPPDQTSYTFKDLVYGENYTAKIRANYSCNVSEPVTYVWQSTYLYPPRNVSDGYVYNTKDVPVYWSPPAKCTPDSLFVNPEGGDGSPDRNQWDLQFSWSPQYNDGENGIESDGNFIYTSKWNGNRFSKYTLDGVWIEDFTIDGVSHIRDMAYDGTYFYGGAVDYTVYKMDFDNHTLINTFQAPVKVRAIAYNNSDQTFYASNLGPDIYEFTADGTTVSSFTVNEVTNAYGMAYDNCSFNGPFLWLYNQGENNLV